MDFEWVLMDLEAARLREFGFLRQLSAYFHFVRMEANVPKRIRLGHEHRYPGKHVNTRPSAHKCAFLVQVSMTNMTSQNERKS